ncbi:MAG: hypothetical protein U0L18_00365 [Acutalibacteraceae bacterium]|nr:hypothetical protein [Acutalibacteraceae bacterium]
MIFDFENIEIEDGDWKCIILQYLNGWTEIPLNRTTGYDIEELKFFDGLIGTLLKHTENAYYNNPDCLNKEFVDSWKYQGKLYRILHQSTYTDKNGKRHCRLPRVQYHRMITHWTNDYTFKGLLHKLSRDQKYIILEADTKEHFAFDVNKFRKANGCEETFTKDEKEIIFPMYKEHIKEYRMTIREFVEKKQEELRCESEKDV